MNKFKIIVFTILLGFSFLTVLAQEDLYEHLAEEACSCMKDKDTNQMKIEQLQMEFGVCIIKGIGTYKGDMEGLDLSDKEGMYELGEKVGIRMAVKCPDMIMKIAKASDANSIYEEDEFKTITGTIVSFEGTDILSIFVKDTESGRENKFLWLRYFKGSDQMLKNYKDFVGRKVELKYSTIECFIPKLGQYFEQKEITELLFLD